MENHQARTHAINGMSDDLEQNQYLILFPHDRNIFPSFLLLL